MPSTDPLETFRRMTSADVSRLLNTPLPARDFFERLVRPGGMRPGTLHLVTTGRNAGRSVFNAYLQAVAAQEHRHEWSVDALPRPTLTRAQTRAAPVPYRAVKVVRTRLGAPDAWHAQHCDWRGRWLTVQNQDGRPMCYATHAAAMDQARYSHRATPGFHGEEQLELFD